jgi:hypothetical protein
MRRLFAITALFFVSCAVTLRAQTIQIKLVDGKTGHPVKNACMSLWPTVDVLVRTDKEGVALLRFTNKDSEVNIPYNLKLWCGPTGAVNPTLKYDDTLTLHTGADYPSCAFPESMPDERMKDMDPISTKEIFQHGFASANTCGNVTGSPQPGEVILFVRPRNHQEKKHDCEAGEFPVICW